MIPNSLTLLAELVIVTGIRSTPIPKSPALVGEAYAGKRPNTYPKIITISIG